MNIFHIDTVKEFRCAGVLIRRNILLTARSCVHGPGNTHLHGYKIEITVGFHTLKEQVNLLRLSFSFKWANDFTMG